VFSNNHYNDGHVAVLVHAPPGVQSILMEAHLKSAANRLTLVSRLDQRWNTAQFSDLEYHTGCEY